ncbi:hypothetical protein RclHR1_25660001 [Rhizophagus clarus]|uniref:Uncharacterized protein n=1 Tax=Rhizophagus clarus TaxID=94130 RepID=A0A2Z6R0V8_9GLOM|nr:hypothetical protein RclHR1_25660001 [Rhizophagus clarus]GES72489.1 hypothetical protein RCL_jg25230.t1 [Rhizophagus clarus]
MQNLAVFYLTNAKKELPHYGNRKTSEKLQFILHDANLYNDDKMKTELNDETNDIYASEDDNNGEDVIHLEQILDLDVSEILEDLDELIEDFNPDLEKKN